MILETVVIEPFVFYDTKEQLKNAYFSLIGKERLEEWKKIEKEQIENNELIKRVHNFELNEFEKYVVVYYSMWKNRRSREKNLHYLEYISEIIGKDSWFISEYKLKLIWTYKMWMKEYYIEHVMENNKKII
jgi:hypothetical protein